MLTGSVVTNVEEARGAAQELLKRGCKSVIITLGPQGCVVVQAQESTSKHVPTTAVKAIDTTVSSLEQGNDTIMMGGRWDYFEKNALFRINVILYLLNHCPFKSSLRCGGAADASVATVEGFEITGDVVAIQLFFLSLILIFLRGQCHSIGKPSHLSYTGLCGLFSPQGP